MPKGRIRRRLELRHVPVGEHLAGFRTRLVERVEHIPDANVCMLILVDTGKKPNRAMEQMVWYELIGLDSLKELESFIRTRR